MTKNYAEKAHNLLEELEVVREQGEEWSFDRLLLLAIAYALMGVIQEVAVVSMWLEDQRERSKLQK